MPLTKPLYGVGGWGPVVDALIDWYNANEGGFILADNSITDAKISNVAAISADKLADGTSSKVMTSAERIKLASVAEGATENASDAALRDRSTHTGAQSAATIDDFAEAVQDAVAAMMAEGAGIDLVYDDVAGTLTVTSTVEPGGPAGLDPEEVRDTMATALVQGTNIVINVNDAGDTITISTPATVNSTDEQLRDRSTHTGSQAIATVSGLQAALDSKAPASGVNSPPVTVAYAATITPDASAGSVFRCSATGSLTLNDPVNGVNGQLVTIEILASGGDRTLSFAGSVAAPVTIPSGMWWSGSFRYNADIDTWLISDGYGNVVVSGEGGGSVVDATTSTKGIARILGGSADEPTVPWASLTGVPAIPGTEEVQDAAASLLTSGIHTGVTVDYVDAAGRVDLTVTAQGGSTGYATVQDEGASRTQRQTINFVGSGVAVTDDAANSRTVVTVPVGQTELDAKVDSTTIDTMVTITQAAYDALGTKDSRTLYVITG